MTCTADAPCSLLREDLEFSILMARYGLPQRRFVCVAGHSVTTGAPSPVSPTPPVTKTYRPIRCKLATCGTLFTPRQPNSRFHAKPCAEAYWAIYRAARKKRAAAPEKPYVTPRSALTPEVGWEKVATR